MLNDLGIHHFDEWAADFGEIKTEYEYILLCAATEWQIMMEKSPIILSIL